MWQRKRPSKLNELEHQINHLQEDLKKAKEQIASSETQKKQAQLQAEEFKEKLVTLTGKHEETELRLKELSESEDVRVEEFRMIEQECDKTWKSELEALRKKQADDSTALFSAMNEIQNLKEQLEIAKSFEIASTKNTETENIELLSLEQDTADTGTIIESLRNKLKGSEEDHRNLMADTQVQLENANATIDTLRSNGLNSLESYNSLMAELAESRTQVSLLGEIVRKLKEDGRFENGDPCVEIEQLKSALEAAELSYEETEIKSTVHIQTAYEVAETIKVESNHRESTLETALQETKHEISDLKSKLIQKESELKEIMYDLNNPETESAKILIAELQKKLTDKETELGDVMEKKKILKQEMERKEAESIKSIEAANAEIEMARSAEQEALVRVGLVSEESEKISRKESKITEQLEVAQKANSDMEAELKKLRVQTEQWRKAAEAAASILTSGNNGGRLMERSGSLDSDYNSIAGKLMSPFSDDVDDSPLKKKNSNMLRKIGGFLKKGSK